MAMIIKVDGSKKELLNYKLEDLQKAVGGYIEGVKLEDGRMMYVNEDGIAKGLEPNKTATSYFPGATYPILGDVVLLTLEETKKEENDET